MKTNIVLIGMTGSGKTTIAKHLSQALQLPYVDMDHYIEEKQGKSISELFEKGEAHFREIEHQTCEDLAERNEYSIISCGGGVVLNPANIEVLKKTGWIFLIDRPVDHITQDIDIQHRPLLKDGPDKLIELAKERAELYQSAAEVVIKNDKTLESALTDIQAALPQEITNKRSDKL